MLCPTCTRPHPVEDCEIGMGALRRAYETLAAIQAILWHNGPDTEWTVGTIEDVADAVRRYEQAR
jgi:hypothetical protein